MKKTLIVLIAIGIGAFANAQKTKQDEGIKLGIKGGLNVSNLMGDVKDVAIRTSIHAGLVAEIIVNDKISKDIEIIHSKSDLIKKSIKESLNKRKEINYNKVNSIINTEPVKQDVRIVSEKKPIDREKLIEIKKDSIRKTIEKVIPSRPNRRNNLPNIFSGKKNL